MNSREREKAKTRINVQAYVDPRKLARIDIHLYENGISARGYSELVRTIIDVVNSSLPELTISAEQAREWFSKRDFPTEQFTETNKSFKAILPIINLPNLPQNPQSPLVEDGSDDEVRRRLDKLLAGQKGLL